MPNELALTVNDEQYESLIEECRSVIVETEFAARWVIVTGKHSIGKILTESESFKKWSKGEGFVNKFSQDLKCSASNIYQCLKFYEMYPDLTLFPEGKDLSWYKITQKYLSNGDSKEPKPRKVFKAEEIKIAFVEWYQENIGTDFNSALTEFLKHLQNY